MAENLWGVLSGLLEDRRAPQVVDCARGPDGAGQCREVGGVGRQLLLQVTQGALGSLKFERVPVGAIPSGHAVLTEQEPSEISAHATQSRPIARPAQGQGSRVGVRTVPRASAAPRRILDPSQPGLKILLTRRNHERNLWT